MAATGAHWETVRKPSKKSKAPAQNGLSKAQKKSVLENMPRIEAAPPVKESSTIYDAFLEKERQQAMRDAPKQQTTHQPGNGTAHKKGSHGQKGGKHTGGDKRDQGPNALEQAVKNVDVKELENVLERAQATFPDNSSVWLKDLVSLLNLKMDKVPEPDPVFHGKSNDYPLCLLPSPAKKMLLKTINQCSSHTLEHFMEHCVQSMVQDMSKGISTYGYRMLLQLLLHEKPDIGMPSLHKYQEMIKLNQNRPLRCLAILWAIGQCGVKKVQNGLRVWLEFMFPMLNMRALSTYCVEYLENLFRMHENLKPAMNTLKGRDFFKVVDSIFTPHPSLPSPLQKRLQAMYPNLQRVAFGTNPESNLHVLFPMFFTRCTGENKTLQPLILRGLVDCLATDKSSFSEWRQLYTKSNLPRSALLLEHISSNWDNVSKVIDRKILKETVGSFNVTNDHMATKGAQQVEGFNDCAALCKDILAKMSGSRFPWRFLVLLTFAIIGGLLAYDTYSSKGFKHSKTRKFLADSGILVFLEQVWNRLCIFSKKAFVWLQENVPFYYAKVREFVGPYLQLFWEKLYELGVYLVKVTEPIRAWLNEKIPQLLEWVQKNFPWFLDGVVYYASIVWRFVVTYSVWIWEHLVTYTNMATTWLLTNVFTGSLSPENILATLSAALSTLQSYIMAAIQWVINVFNGAPATSDTATPSVKAQ